MFLQTENQNCEFGNVCCRNLGFVYKKRVQEKLIVIEKKIKHLLFIKRQQKTFQGVFSWETSWKSPPFVRPKIFWSFWILRSWPLAHELLLKLYRLNQRLHLSKKNWWSFCFRCFCLDHFSSQFVFENPALWFLQRQFRVLHTGSKCERNSFLLAWVSNYRSIWAVFWQWIYFNRALCN